MAERSREIQTFRIELGEKTEFSDFKKNRINQAIKSIVIGRASNPNVVIKAKTKEGDEFYLHVGRVVNFKNPITGIFFSWPAYTNEWIDVDISENEHLVGFTPLQGTSLASNIASKRVVKFVDIPYWGYGAGQVKLLDQNPNRLKAEFEVIGPRRIVLGDQAKTLDATANDVRLANGTPVMPFSRISLNSSEEVWAIDDSSYRSAYDQGIGTAGQTIKVTEFLK